MALSKNSVDIAINILKAINISPLVNVQKCKVYDRNDNYASVNQIYCIDEKADLGFENVIINIENISEEQLNTWNELKGSVPNSSMTDLLEGTNITRIGWY